MARRFGRNQKRRMRAEVAMHAHTAEHLRDVVRARDKRIAALSKEALDLQVIISRYERVVEQARDVLGRYWVGLPPLARHSDYIADRMYIPVESRPPPPLIADYCADFGAMVSKVEMMTMRGDFRIDAIKHEAHVVFKTPVGAVGYGFTRQAFMNCPKAYTEKLIAQQMAEYLVNNTDFQKLTQRSR